MKLTKMKWASYWVAKRELLGISYNDSYNVATYGITRDEYMQINKALIDLYGMERHDINFVSYSKVKKHMDQH